MENTNLQGDSQSVKSDGGGDLDFFSLILISSDLMINNIGRCGGKSPVPYRKTLTVRF